MIRLGPKFWYEDPDRPLVLPTVIEPGHKIQYGNTLLRVDENRRVFDEMNVEIAVADELMMVDRSDKCGVGPISIGDKNINKLCRPHDFKYSSAVYQETHTREEADNDLERDFKLAGYARTGKHFAELARTYGWRMWENLKTKARRFKL